MADPEGGEFCAFLRDPAELPAYRLHGIGIDRVDARAQAAWWGDVFGVAGGGRGPGLVHPRARDARSRADAGLRAGARATCRPQPRALGRHRRRRRAARPPARRGSGTCRTGPCSRTRRATSSACSRARTDHPAGSIDGFEHGHRDRPAGSSLVLRDLGRLGQHHVRPHGVALRADQLTGHDRQPPGPHLHLGRLRRAQVAEPVGVAGRARPGAPHDEPLGGVEVAHAGGARHAGPSAGCRDHQDVHVLAAAGQPPVEGAVHPHADHGCRIASTCASGCSSGASLPRAPVSHLESPAPTRCVVKELRERRRAT